MDNVKVYADETFRQRVSREHPEAVNSYCGGGVQGCPKTYGYEDSCPCLGSGRLPDDACTWCWNRKIPKKGQDTDKIHKIIPMLRRLKIETGSLACLGCGHENSCSIHGCAILRETIEILEDVAEKENLA